jgi:20S proteasome alpha/beta subunit
VLQNFVARAHFFFLLTTMVAIPPLVLDAQEPASSYVHGTIDVVVSTRDGFILATDSRGTQSNGSHSDDFQKVFTVGGRTACVVAGLTGADLGAQGFRLRDAIASHLVLLDRSASSNQLQSNAAAVARTFEGGFQGVVGLLNPGTASLPSLVSATSIVSLTANREPEWITFYLPVAMKSDSNGEMYLTTGQPIYLFHSLNLGPRFDVEAIGYPDVARSLVRADKPGESSFSKSKIMRRFYKLKRKGRLDEISLDDGVELAKQLVAATIAVAPTTAGVGGPIDILTVTKDGVRWIQRKQVTADLPPPYIARFFNSTLGAGHQDLDGLECVRCLFRDMALRYNGDRDVQLLGCTFAGSCTLTLARDARNKNPEAVARLLNLVAGKCQVIEERPH